MLNSQIVCSSSLRSPEKPYFDYIELLVGNVRHAMHYYSTIWGFQPIALMKPDDRVGDRISIAMRQGCIVLLLTGTSTASSPIAHHLHQHGESIATIAFAVDDAHKAYELAVIAGATPVRKPTVLSDENGEVVTAEVRVFDGFTHAFVERSAYVGRFLPGFLPMSLRKRSKPIFEVMDHIAIAVERGSLNAWVDFYQRAFGFEVAHTEDVATERTGMNSKVIQHPSGTCKFPIVEPALGRRKSQVQDFLDSHNGPGVQHLGIQTNDILNAVTRLRSKGVEFLPIPSSYYDELESRVGSLQGCLSAIRNLGILVDNDEWGHLLQVFTRPTNDRTTLFFEVIERRGARGFGGGNIRALFEAIERTQESGGDM